MQKGVDIVRVLIVPEAVREPRKGERFQPTVTVGVARSARDGVDVFVTGTTGEAQAGRNPRIAECARELLALVAQEIADTGRDVTFVGSVAGAFVEYRPGGPMLVSASRDESRDSALHSGLEVPSILDAPPAPSIVEPPAPEPPAPPMFGSGADSAPALPPLFGAPPAE